MREKKGISVLYLINVTKFPHILQSSAKTLDLAGLLCRVIYSKASLIKTMGSVSKNASLSFSLFSEMKARSDHFLYI